MPGKGLEMKKLITCLVACVLSGVAFAETWTVDDDGKADFDNIQAAVNADEPRGSIREIMPCDLGPITENRGVTWGTLWPAGTVYYDFDASISQLNRDRTRAAMDVLETATEMGTVFIPRTNEPDYIHIIEGGGNWSSVGMQGGSQNLSMYNWSYQFIICHELIHALGRLHQQSRSDRDNYITVNWECIDSNYAYNYDICGQCPNYGEYDFESVMHYSQWGFNTGCPTMTCLPGYEEFQDVMGQRDYLSNGDIETLRSMYPIQSATGACCVGTAGGCIDNLSESGCLAGSGTWHGPGSVCADGDCELSNCDGDADDSGVVDVGDILVVIDQWGLADSPADVNNDGIVNVSDLLMVIDSWGTCL